HVYERRRALRIPPVLVGAHPLHAYWATDRARKQSGVGRRILVPVTPVASRTVDVDYTHVRLGHSKHQSELFAQVVCGLAGRPARQLDFFECRDRARGTDGTMRMDGEVIRGRKLLVRLGERRINVTAVAGNVFMGDMGG